MRIHGIPYKLGSVLRVKSSPFLYAKIADMYIYKDHKIFITYKVNVQYFNQHMRAIEVEITEEICCLFDDLYCHGVLHLKQLDMYLIEKDNRVNPSFFY